jgi:Pyruvate/2-oxoacid:ferredoxin oxidoreductase delta subunit
MADSQKNRRVIEVNRPIAGDPAPLPKPLTQRKADDYPQSLRPWLDVARKLSSPLRMGPPLCDELLAFVQHLFSEEEARLVRRLGFMIGRTASDVARAERVDSVAAGAVLERLAFQTRTIGAGGPPENRRYYLLPIVPGIFEMVLIGCSPETLSDWHRRFIELFETLFESGYSRDYRGGVSRLVRYLPIGQAVEAHPMALPSDRLEVVLDRFDKFGVGQCQCRLAMQALGRGCGKPLTNCAVMGEWAERGIENGWLRSVSKKNVIEIKREAESHGLVTWMMNVEVTRGQSSCSCCGCCCHAMRAVSEFNAPGAIAPPHFMPRWDASKCVRCGQCVKACPMRALTISRTDAIGGGGSVSSAETATDAAPWFQVASERCIGCGLCALACGQHGAIAMEPTPDYRMPYRSWFSLIARSAPKVLQTSWNVWRQRG